VGHRTEQQHGIAKTLLLFAWITVLVGARVMGFKVEQICDYNNINKERERRRMDGWKGRKAFGVGG
jgi:hypothetical protein